MKTLPFAANATLVGSVSPLNTTVSVKPAGKEAAPTGAATNDVDSAPNSRHAAIGMPQSLLMRPCIACPPWRPQRSGSTRDRKPENTGAWNQPGAGVVAV